MTEADSEIQPTDPGHNPGVDPPRDDEAARSKDPAVQYEEHELPGDPEPESDAPAKSGDENAELG